ncbi:deSI-like protein At4g17486 [Vicia villosa]|uniref:deSI-like protein At4g17486 n=1 Tax=Vicia villosa TaxID=3911 RepID=UPI00273BB741|nr:deSI-like protein At4g17486 [Vicia villosa]
MKYVEKDAAFERRFQQVYMAEPSVPDTVSILSGLKERYEGHHGVRIQDRAIVVAAQLSSWYITVGCNRLQLCSYSQFRSFIERLSTKYHGETYHLIAKNCNHFTDEVCQELTGKPIPAWVNRLARVGSFCNCLLPESLQVEAVRHQPDHIPHSDEEETESEDHSASDDSEEEDSNHHLLDPQNGVVSFMKEKPVAE